MKSKYKLDFTSDETTRGKQYLDGQENTLCSRQLQR